MTRTDHDILHSAARKMGVTRQEAKRILRGKK